MGAGVEISTKGAYLRKIDGELPARYTRKLYGNLPRNRAYLLTQLRTGHNWLYTYAKRYGFREDDLCECGAQETFSHVLLYCPNLQELRGELRRKAGDACNSVSSLLGGSTEGEKGEPANGRRRCRPYWTSPRRHSGSAVVRHEGSLTTEAAMGQDRP